MSVDIKQLKQHILNNHLLEQLFESMDIQHVGAEQGGRLVTGGLPPRFNSQNTRSVQGKYNVGLSCHIRNRNDFSGDIISLVSYIEFDARTEEEYKHVFHKALDFICKELGIDEGKMKADKERIDYALPIKNLMKKIKRQGVIKPNPPIPEDILDNYYQIFPLQWINEGIDWETLAHFDIRMDSGTNRAIIPIRNKRGRLIGTKGRLLLEDGEVLPEGAKKYMYLDPCNASTELYNLHEAYPEIKSSNQVFVFEGEKSVMKAWQEGFVNSVAIASSSFSKEQYRLLHECNPKVEICLCYDNDKEVDDIKEVLNGLELDTLPYHSISFVRDINNLLSPKSSPIDGGVEIFETLLEENCYELV